MALLEDNKLRAVLLSLAACLCLQIEKSGTPKVCTCGVFPGELVIPEYQGDCDDDAETCGLAWVRMTSAYPAQSVGISSDTEGSCGNGIGVDLNIGISRCIDLPEDPTETLDRDELANISFMTVADMLTIRKAIQCCEGLEKISGWRLGTYTPFGPLGGYVGGAFTLQLLLTNV